MNSHKKLKSEIYNRWLLHELTMDTRETPGKEFLLNKKFIAIIKTDQWPYYKRNSSEKDSEDVINSFLFMSLNKHK